MNFLFLALIISIVTSLKLDYKDHIYSRDPDTGYIYLDPRNQKHTNTVIFLHGYGGDATSHLRFFTSGHGALPSSRIILA